MFLQAFRTSLARHALGLASSSDILDGAHSALDGGIYSESLGEIVTAWGRNDFEMNALFGKALLELDVARPTAEHAVWELAASYFVPLAEGRCKPVEVCSRCYYDHNAIEYGYNPIHQFEDKITWGPIQDLVGFYYRYDYPGEEHESIDEECLAFATGRSRKYWRSILDHAWLTPTVQSIAAAIYEDRAFDRLPILADALEEAGCTDADVLLHCRVPAEHVRGCWVVDLVLGKT